ncbi:MAG: hypothetical protein ACKOPS_11485 [Cyanobium sp.]
MKQAKGDPALLARLEACPSLDAIAATAPSRAPASCSRAGRSPLIAAS